MSETKPDLMAELAEVVRLSERATAGQWDGGEAPCLRDAQTGAILEKLGDCGSVISATGFTIATTYHGPIFSSKEATRELADANAAYIAALSNFLRTHHAELEAVVRDAESWRQLLASVGAEQLVAASKKHGDATGVLRDAARYRWLRERNAMLTEEGSEPPYNFCVTDDQPDGDTWVGSDLDAAIDQAMHNSAREGL